MSKLNRRVRKELLDLQDEHQAYIFEGKFLALNDDLITISQLRLQGKKEVLATHVNLPRLLTLVSPSIEEFKKGNSVSIKGRVGSYSKNGERRAAIFVDEYEKKILLDKI